MQTSVIPVKKSLTQIAPVSWELRTLVATVDAHPFRLYIPCGGLARAGVLSVSRVGTQRGYRGLEFLASPASPTPCKCVLWAWGAIAGEEGD